MAKKDIENTKQRNIHTEPVKDYDVDRKEYERLYKEIEDSALSKEDKAKRLIALKEQYTKHLELYETDVNEEEKRIFSEKQKEIAELKKVKEELLKVADKLRSAGFITETGDVSGSVDSTDRRASQAEKAIEQSQNELEEFERLAEEKRMFSENNPVDSSDQRGSEEKTEPASIRRI